MAKKNIASVVHELALSLALKQEVEIWDVEYKKEGADYFLRVFIDKKDGITINDCEKFSREFSDILDREDPIENHYYLEISSAGLDRQLKKPEHFNAFIGSDVDIKLFKPINGSKELLEAKLLEYTPEAVKVHFSGEERTVETKDISQVRLTVKF